MYTGRGLTLADNCGRITLITGGVVGAIVGGVVGLPFGATVPGAVIGFVAGAIVAGEWNPANCNSQVCDDCDHPEKIVPNFNFEECRFSEVQVFGAFEYAESWEWLVEVIDETESYSTTTLVPRVEIPEDFNLDQMDFEVFCWTVCDGGLYPATLWDSNTGETLEVDDKPADLLVAYDIPSPNWGLMGLSVVDPTTPITYLYESTEPGGQLANPVWSVDNAQIVSQGKQNGRYFAEVSFQGDTDESEIIRLTLYDDCSEKETTRSINTYLIAL